MDYQNLLVVTAFILIYSVLSKPLEKSIFSGALLATLFGVLAGPYVLNFFQIQIEKSDYRLIAELALALVLFTDASKTNIRSLTQNALLPKRLLGIGLPLTIGLGTVAAYFIFPDLSILEMGILATLLAPTDAALGKPVVSNNGVPVKIREGLNVESGLNDGICVPVLFLLLGLYEAEQGVASTHNSGVLLFVEEIGIGLLVGVATTYLVAQLLKLAHKKDWIGESWNSVLLVALAFGCFALAQTLGGSGFIACFTGGLLYGKLNKNHHSLLISGAEGLGDSISMLTWLIFGSAVLYKNFAGITWDVVLYAMLSLTLIRIIPVLVSLLGTKFSLQEKLFIGWFGPRGLASIVFAIIVMEVDLPHEQTIILTAICTILLSIVLHGVSAKPFINALAKTEKVQA